MAADKLLGRNKSCVHARFQACNTFKKIWPKKDIYFHKMLISNSAYCKNRTLTLSLTFLGDNYLERSWKICMHGNYYADGIFAPDTPIPNCCCLFYMVNEIVEVEF